MSLVALVSAYLVGGITFLPLVIFLFVYLHPVIRSEVSDFDSSQTGNATSADSSEYLKAGEIEEDNQSGLDAYKAGWIYVTQEYLDSPDDINSTTQAITESNDNKSAYSSLFKLVQKDNEKNGEKQTIRARSDSFDTTATVGSITETISDSIESTNSANGNSINTIGNPHYTSATNYSNSEANTNVIDNFNIEPDVLSSTTSMANNVQPPQLNSANSTNTEKLRNSQKKHRYYAILKHGNLFLYKDEFLKDVRHVIVLSNYFISIWPRQLSDGTLFTKSSSIAIIKSSKLASLNSYTEEETTPKGSFFLYTDVNIDKEDWYFALIRATKLSANSELHDTIDPQIYAKTLHFQTKHMIDLIQTLYSSEGQLQTKWFNALIGRLFLSFQHTHVLENYLRTKLSKKLNKIKKPGFLDKFQIKSISAGDSAPFLTYPSLKEISPDGTVIVSMYVSYHGNMSLQISTKANINFGVRFKPREVDMLLSVTLSKLEGPVLIKIKPPPSERLWYTFETEPIMNLKIEPIISSRQMSYNIITNSIEKKFKEAVKDSLVLPHWDDIVFYDTSDEIYRGGIWDPSARESSGGTEGEVETINSAASSNEVDIDLDSKSELTYRSPNKNKLTNTLTDLSYRIKKKTSHISPTNSSNFNNSSNTQEVPSSPNKNSAAMNTLKKIGKWYFKDDKAVSEEKYTPPEMISNRRIPRKTSNADLGKLPSPNLSNTQPSYAFGKPNDNLSLFEAPNKPVSSKPSSTSLNGAHNAPRSPIAIPIVEDSAVNRLDISTPASAASAATRDEDTWSTRSGHSFSAPIPSSPIPTSTRSATVATTLASVPSTETHHKLHRKAPTGSPPKLPERDIPESIKAPNVQRSYSEGGETST